MSQNDILVNNYLKGCAELRTALLRLVYDEDVLDEILEKIHDNFKDKIIDYKIFIGKLEITVTFSKEDFNNISMSTFFDIVHMVLLERIKNNKDEIINYNNELKVVIDKIESGELDISGIYNMIETDDNSSHTVHILL